MPVHAERPAAAWVAVAGLGAVGGAVGRPCFVLQLASTQLGLAITHWARLPLPCPLRSG